MTLESLRNSYRPPSVRTLFVGESPPAGGTFFYHGNSNLARYTCEALLGAPASESELREFPVSFCERGFYFVDLCLEPVDGLTKTERHRVGCEGVGQLAATMRELRPAAIVVVMKGIQRPVRRAVEVAALSHLPFYVLPFPSHGHQRE